jgi:hypothetical protein
MPAGVTVPANPPPLTLALPPPGSPATAQCAREDLVVVSSLQSVGLSGGCHTYALSLPAPGFAAALLNVHATAAGWAYLDNESAQPSGFECANTGFLPFEAPAPPCSTRWTATNQFVQRALTCQFFPGQQVYLHVNASAAVANHAWTAQQDPNSADQSGAGSLYLLAIHEPVGSPALEETVFFVGRDNVTTRLVTEQGLS